MHVPTTSWRCWLMAAALCAICGRGVSRATADDNPASAGAPWREKVHEKLQTIRERAEQLDKAGEHEAAQRLRHEAEIIKIKAVHPEGTTPAAPANIGPDKEKIIARLKEMGQRIEQLKKEGKLDRAEQLQKEARELHSKLNWTLAPAGPSPERQKLYKQYKALHEKIAAAAKNGYEDEVHRLTKEMEELRGKFHAPAGAAVHHLELAAREARLQHLRVAVEHLAAAGCEAEARQVKELIGRAEAEARQATERPGAYHPDAPNPALQELRSQIEQMRREMRQMREELNRLKSGDHH